MFPYLEAHGKDISDAQKIESIFTSPEFVSLSATNVFPLIYDEKNQRCNIMIFDHKKAVNDTTRIVYVDKNEKFDFEANMVVAGKGRAHPIFMFLNSAGGYICEVRYGGASANALQRGLWTHTKNALAYFESLTNGWMDYAHNHTLVKLFSLALNSTEDGHKLANEILQKDIDKLKKM